MLSTRIEVLHHVGSRYHAASRHFRGSLFEWRTIARGAAISLGNDHRQAHDIICHKPAIGLFTLLDHQDGSVGSQTFASV